MAHRLRVVDGPAEIIFAVEALALLHEASQGSLRATDRLTRLALQDVSSTAQQTVSAAVIKPAVAVDMRGK